MTLQLNLNPANSIPQAVLARIRASLARSADGRNAAERAPLLAPPAWAANTVYQAGEVVTNAGGGAGNLYICSVAGQSAASVGPTGVGAATIVDNAASWQYFGAVKTVTSQANAPAVSFAAYTTTPANSWYWANAAQTYSAAVTGGPQYFYLDGGYWVNTTQFGGTPGMTCFNALGGSVDTATAGGVTSSFWNNRPGSFTIRSDAPKLMINGAVNYAAGAGGMFVEIDETPLSDTPFFPTANGQGLVLDFSAVTGREVRTIRVYASYITGVSTFDTTSQVWAYVPPNPFTMAVVGDSTGVGSAAGPFGLDNYNWQKRLARMIGCDNTFNNAVGSIGFCAQNTNGFAYLQSFAAIPGYSPDVVFVAGNLNDQSTASATRQAAITAFLQNLRSKLPVATVIVVGPWGATQNASAGLVSCEADLGIALAAQNDPNMFFVPLIARSSGQSWVTGTGTIAAPAATGNSSQYVYSDGTHPVALAHKDFMPKVYADVFRSVIQRVASY